MSTNKIISELNAEQMGKELPEFGPGDTLVVQVKVIEGARERLQAFERYRGLSRRHPVRVRVEAGCAVIDRLGLCVRRIRQRLAGRECGSVDSLL